MPKILAFTSLLFSGCALLTLRTADLSYPQLNGEIQVSGIQAPIAIHRDAYGVPHIRAETEADLWFAMGFVHAQDRLFQMDLIRRLGSGRLSAWMGEEAFEFDLLMQSLELKKRFEGWRKEMAPDLLAVGVAYAAGINAGAASLPELPVEYRLMGVEWEPWQSHDALAVTTINAWGLSENAPRELIALLTRDTLSAADLDALWRWGPEAPAVDAYWDELRDIDVGGLSGPMRGLIETIWGVHTPSASNNWAVSAERSADGFPILASDPHMKQIMPSLWYVAEGRGGEVHIAGAALAGSPFFAVGHNEQVAWGVTNTMMDYVDLAVLERVGEKGYLLAGEERMLRPVTRSIEVAGHGLREGTVYWTEVGPVITELEGSHLVALRWSLFEVPDRTGELFYALQKSTSTEEAMEAARLPSILSQNLVMADVHGNIARQTFGAAPKRRGFTGQVPYPASDPSYGWDGWIEELPTESNPERGYLHTANDRSDHPNADVISASYLPPWRANRIAQLIEERPKHSLESFHQIQMDELDQHAGSLVPKLLAGIDPHHNACSRILTEWDFDSRLDLAGPAVWAVFQGELLRGVLENKMGAQAFELYLAAAIAGRSALDGDWQRFVDEPKVEVRAALDRTCVHLEDKLGPDPALWQWGAIHPLRIRHPFSDQSRFLEDWSLPTVPYGGSHQTVNQSGYSWHDPLLETTWMASLRLIVPLSDPGKATFIYPGGQSGQPGHPHAQDLFPVFLAGEQLPLWFDDEDVLRASVNRLNLLPKRKLALNLQ
jgi:penicillin amidase